MAESDQSSMPWEMGLFAPSVSQLSYLDTVKLLAKSGYRWIEWRVQTQHDIESSPWGKALNTLVMDRLVENAKEIVQLLKTEKIGVSALQVDVPYDYPKLAPLLLETAKILDCPRVLVVSPKFDPATPYKQQRDDFRSYLAGWVKVFEGSAVKVCLENHFDTLVPSVALASGLLEVFSPAQTGVMWDPANGILEGNELPAMALNLLGEYLSEVHLKNTAWLRQQDGSWGFTFCALPDGIVNWPAVLQLLQEKDYRGPLVVEDYSPVAPEQKLAAAHKHLENAVAALKKL